MDSRLSPADLERLLDHTEWLRSLARRLVHDSAAADDLVQETWIAALRSPPDRTLPVRPWLAGVVRNLALMHRRGEGRRVAREDQVARREALPSTADLLAEVDLERRLKDLVVLLDEPLRTTVLLRYHEGLTSAEIARRQGVPAGTVRWRLKRGLDLLRVELDQRYGGREAWLASLAVFARIEPATGLAAGASGGAGLTAAGASGVLVALALALAAGVALVALGPGGCAQASRPGASEVSAVTRGPEAATPAPGDLVAAAAEDSRRAQPAEAGAPAAGAPARPAPAQLLVTDADGVPVVGAEVVALTRSGDPLRGRTDGAGWVDLGGTRGTAVVFVARAGAFLHRAEVLFEAEPAAAPAAATTPPGPRATLALPRGQTLSGRVLVGGNAPRAPLLLELDSDTHLWGGAALPPAVAELLGNGRRSRVATDRDGGFVFQGLAADWAGVLWLPPTHRAVEARAGAYGDESVYFERARDDVVLALEPRGFVRGRIVDAAGAPVAGASVRVFTRALGDPVSATASPLGVFQAVLGADPGEVVVEVTAPSGGPAETRRFAALPEDGELGDLTLDLGRALGARDVRPLSVAVVDADGAPRGGLYLRLSADGPVFGAADARATGARPLVSGPRSALFELGPGGALALADVVALTDVELAVEDAAANPLARATYVRGALEHDVQLVVDAPTRPLEVIVRDEDGGILVGAVVQLVQGEERGAFRRTGLAGHTVFPAVAAAAASLSVQVQKRGYVTRRRPDLPMPGPGAALELVLERGVDVVILVTDRAGAPVVDARVEVACGTAQAIVAAHAGEGRYRVDDVPRGPLTVVAESPAGVGRLQAEVTGPAELPVSLGSPR